MISKKITQIKKIIGSKTLIIVSKNRSLDEILEAYQAGENTNTLAEKYSVSSNTINRTVKSLLSDIEYKWYLNL